MQLTRKGIAQPRALYLSSSALYYTLFACTLLSLLCSACSGNSGSTRAVPTPERILPAPTSFVASLADSLVYMEWRDAGKGQLTGSYILTDIAGQQQEGTITGSKKNTQVTLSGAHFVLNGVIEQQSVQSHFSSGQGALQSVKWYAISQSAYQQLAKVFPSYTRINADEKAVNALLQSPVQNSDPNYFQTQVTAAGNYVRSEQNSLDIIKVTEQNQICSQIHTFQTTFPLSQDPAVLPFAQPQDKSADDVVNRSSLAQAVNALQGDWQKTSALHLPHLTGYQPAWISNPQSVLATGEMELGQLQTSVLKASQWFQSLAVQHNDIQEQIKQLATKCP